MVRRPISEDERALWQSVAKTARPLKRRRKSAPAPIAASNEKSAPKTAKIKTKPAARAPTPAPAPSATRHHELSHGLSVGIDKRQAERFRGGRLPIEGRIDL